MPGVALQPEPQQFSPLALLLSGAMRARQNAAAQPNMNPATPAGTASIYGGAPTPAPQPAPLPAAQPAAAAPIQPANTGLPAAPKPPDLTDQMKRYQDLQRMVMEPAPNPKDFELHGIRKVLGALALGAATFGSGLSKNPMFAEMAQENLNRPFKQATDQWNQRRSQAEQASGMLKDEMGATRQNFDDRLGWFNAEIARSKTENTYDSDVQQEVGSDGKLHYYKISQSGQKMEVPEPTQVVTDRWRTKDEARKDKQDAETKRHNQETERIADKRADNADGRGKDYNPKLVQVEQKANDDAKRHKDKINARIDAAGKQRKKTELVNGAEAAQKEYADTMAAIERDDYAGMRRIGQSYAKQAGQLGVKIDAPEPEPWEESYLSDGERPGVREAAPASAPAKPAAKPQAAPQKQPAAAPAGPPASLFKGEGHTLKLRNKTTGKVETWKMQNGAPVKVG